MNIFHDICSYGLFKYLEKNFCIFISIISKFCHIVLFVID